MSDEPASLPAVSKLMLEELLRSDRADAVIKAIQAEYSQLVKEHLSKASEDSLIYQTVNCGKTVTRP